MGIYDRDYYRRDGSGFMVFANRGAVCKWLIAINVGMFLLQIVTMRAGVSVTPPAAAGTTTLIGRSG